MLLVLVLYCLLREEERANNIIFIVFFSRHTVKNVRPEGSTNVNVQTLKTATDKSFLGEK